jgi:hypothetical protein
MNPKIYIAPGAEKWRSWALAKYNQLEQVRRASDLATLKRFYVPEDGVRIDLIAHETAPWIRVFGGKPDRRLYRSNGWRAQYIESLTFIEGENEYAALVPGIGVPKFKTWASYGPAMTQAERYAAYEEEGKRIAKAKSVCSRVHLSGYIPGVGSLLPAQIAFRVTVPTAMRPYIPVPSVSYTEDPSADPVVYQNAELYLAAVRGGTFMAGKDLWAYFWYIAPGYSAYYYTVGGAGLYPGYLVPVMFKVSDLVAAKAQTQSGAYPVVDGVMVDLHSAMLGAAGYSLPTPGSSFTTAQLASASLTTHYGDERIASFSVTKNSETTSSASGAIGGYSYTSNFYQYSWSHTAATVSPGWGATGEVTLGAGTSTVTTEEMVRPAATTTWDGDYYGPILYGHSGYYPVAGYPDLSGHSEIAEWAVATTQRAQRAVVDVGVQTFPARSGEPYGGTFQTCPQTTSAPPPYPPAPTGLYANPGTSGWTGTYVNYRTPPVDEFGLAEPTVYGVYSKPDVTVYSTDSGVAASLPAAWSLEPTISQPTFSMLSGSSSGTITGIYEYSPGLTTNTHRLVSAATFAGSPAATSEVRHGAEMLTALNGYIQLSWPDALEDGTYGLFVAQVVNQTLFNSASAVLKSSSSTEEEREQARADIMASVDVKLNNCMTPDLLAYLVSGYTYFVA